MPPRRDVVARMVEWIADGPWVWDGRTGTINEPANKKPMTTELYEHFHDVLDDVFVRAMRSIDWTRLIREAEARHYVARTTDPAHERIAEALEGRLCGTCLRETLLSRVTHKKWEDSLEHEQPAGLAIGPLIAGLFRSMEELRRLKAEGAR